MRYLFIRSAVCIAVLLLFSNGLKAQSKKMILHQTLQDELKKLVIKWKPKNAYIIAVAPSTGKKLGAVAYSSDPESPQSPFCNIRFEPGSAVKPIVMAAALDAGIITPETKIDCDNGYNPTMRLRDMSPLGVADTAQTVKMYSNIGTAKIAVKMGKEKLYKALEKFGFCDPFPQQSKNRNTVLKPIQQWYDLSITRFAIGQGFSITPLQLCRAYCMLLNGGRQIAINNHSDTVAKAIESSSSIFCTPKTSSSIINMLKINTPTEELKLPPNSIIGGSTFVTQKWEKEKQRYSKTKFYSGFIGFAGEKERDKETNSNASPNVPSLVLLVLLDESKGNHYGGTVALPTFKAIAAKALYILKN